MSEKTIVDHGLWNPVHNKWMRFAYNKAEDLFMIVDRSKSFLPEYETFVLYDNPEQLADRLLGWITMLVHLDAYYEEDWIRPVGECYVVPSSYTGNDKDWIIDWSSSFSLSEYLMWHDRKLMMQFFALNKCAAL